MPEAPAIRRALREEMRARRLALDDDDQAAAAMAVMARLARLAPLRGTGPVAGYRAVRGELAIDAALVLLHERGTTVTLPRVRGEHLEFVRTDPSAPSVPGSFAIPEPHDGEPVPVQRHAVVLAPVVAFDATGHRLGQGGGYYDRALAVGPGGPRPLFIGIAHAFQEVEHVPAEPWDVPLDAVVTEEAVHEFRPGALDAGI